MVVTLSILACTQLVRDLCRGCVCISCPFVASLFPLNTFWAALPQAHSWFFLSLPFLLALSATFYSHLCPITSEGSSALYLPGMPQNCPLADNMEKPDVAVVGEIVPVPSSPTIFLSRKYDRGNESQPS